MGVNSTEAEDGRKNGGQSHQTGSSAGDPSDGCGGDPDVQAIMLAEWDIVEEQIRNYEEIFLKCRSWALLVFLGSSAVYIEFNMWLAPPLGIFSIVLLMHHELAYMTRQHMMIIRSDMIQKHLNHFMNGSVPVDPEFELPYAMRFSEDLKKEIRKEKKDGYKKFRKNISPEYVKYQKYERIMKRNWILSEEFYLYTGMICVLFLGYIILEMDQILKFINFSLSVIFPQTGDDLPSSYVESAVQLYNLSLIHI